LPPESARVEALNAADWAILTVIGLSMILSLMRGFIREALSLVGWVLAFLVAMVFAERLAYLLAGSIQDPTGRHIVAFAVLFVLTLIVVALLAKLLQSLVEFAGLGGLDRLLGMAFGFARGVFVLLAAVTILRPALQLEQYEWWRQSRLLPHLLLLEGWFRGLTGWLSAVLAGLGNQ
jgi:membrane protein required for colicin V production